MCTKEKSLINFYEINVTDIMKTIKDEIPCINEKTDIINVFNIMNNTDHVWVIDSKEPMLLLGVITESDMIPLLNPPLTSVGSFDKPDLRSLQYGVSLDAEEIMSKKPVTASIDDALKEILLKMKEQKIKHLPVIDENTHLIGEISLHHLIQQYSTLYINNFSGEKKVS